MATFTNVATLTYNNMTTTSNVATGEILEVLSVTKTALTTTYGNSPVTYVVSITNSGTVPFSGLTVTDDLGGYSFNSTTVYPLNYTGDVRQYVNGALQASPAVTAGPPLVFSGVNVPAGGSTVLVYAANPTEYAPRGAGEGVTNTVTVQGSGVSASATDSETVTAAAGPQLSITKTVSPTTVTENGTLTYTIVIQNTGNTSAEASDNLVVSDVFDPVLGNLTVTLNGAPLASGTGYTYDTFTGQFDTVAGAITVPAATFTQDASTGVFTVTPGYSVLQVTGTV